MCMAIDAGNTSITFIAEGGMAPALHYTVATGVTGEPAAPGILNGGAVSKKLLRLFARSHAASSVRYHSSPR